MTKEYMKEVLEHMSIAQLIDTILINPTVHISPSYRDTGLSATYTFKPLSNLVYTRDQQVCFVLLLLVPARISCWLALVNAAHRHEFFHCPSPIVSTCEEASGLRLTSHEARNTV